MSALYKLPEDGSWVDLSKIEAISIVENAEFFSPHKEHFPGPFLQIITATEHFNILPGGRVEDLQRYADNLAKEINKRRGTDIVEKLFTLEHSLQDIKEIASQLSSANPHVKERLQAITRIVDEAMK